MTAEELIRTIEAAGGRLEIAGDQLKIVPKEAAASLREELVEHKPAIIDLLSRRPQMPVGVRLIQWEPKDAPIRLSECSTVTDTDKFIRSTLAQLDARLSGKKFLDGGWGLSGLLARLAACGVVVEIDDPGKTLQ